jgi:hypothetical protein
MHNPEIFGKIASVAAYGSAVSCNLLRGGGHQRTFGCKLRGFSQCSLVAGSQIKSLHYQFPTIAHKLMNAPEPPYQTI